MQWIFLFFLSFGSLESMSRAAPPVQVEHMGVRTLSFEDTKRKRPVIVELWYPIAQNGPLDAPPDPVWVHPKEVRDVSVMEGKHPLIVMSHGHGGDRRDRSWIAEYLVKSGFIVASIEHHGSSWRTYNPLLTMRFWDRARDVTFTINQLMKEGILKHKIDAKRIGFVGYSMGGMTGLALAGARAKNVKEIMILMQKKHEEIEPDLIEKLEFSEAYENFTDARIKAFVLLSPAAFVFPAQSLKSIKAPIAVVASEGDEILPFKEHAFKVIKHLVPAKLKLLKDTVSHYVFLNRVSELGKEVMNKEIQTDEIQSDRVAVHREVGQFAVEFFKEQFHLK
jgi:predicted dienelactone hydrolase